MLERELRTPVEAWLESRGYWVVHELLIGGYCDLYGVSFGPREGRRMPRPQATAAVELKLEDFGGALHQACLYSHCANHTYIAMPARRFAKMLDKTLARATSKGIGLLAVGAGVEVVVEAELKPFEMRKNLWKKTWRRTKRYRVAPTPTRPEE